MTIERLKSHADWLQDRANNPNTVAPGSTDPRSIVGSKRLGEIARDIREFVEDVEDEAKLREVVLRDLGALRYQAGEDDGACPECHANSWMPTRHGDSYKCRNCGHNVTAEWAEDFVFVPQAETANAKA